MELAVEKIIHSQKSIGGSNKDFGDVTDKVKQLKSLFPNWEKEELLNTLYDSKGDIDIAIKNIMEGNAKRLVKDSKKNKEDKENKNKEKDSKDEKDDKLIVDDKVNGNINTKETKTSETVIEKTVSEEVEINKDSKTVSVKSSKSDKKSYKSYNSSGSGRSKSKYLSYDSYYKHYYGGNYRSFSKKSEYKKKSYYEREKEYSKSLKNKKSTDESIKEEKTIENVDTVTQDTRNDKTEIDNTSKKLSWAQIAKPKTDNNRECKVIIEKKSTTEHVIRKEIKSSKENSNETISIKITIKESGNGDSIIQDNNQENIKSFTNEEKLIENNCDIRLESMNNEKKEEIDTKENFDNNEKEDQSLEMKPTSPISNDESKEKEHTEIQEEEEEEIKVVLDSETENEQEKTLLEENINGKSENSTEVIHSDLSEKKEDESETTEDVEKDKDINENIIVIDNRSRIDKLNEKIAKIAKSRSNEEIYTATKIPVNQDKKGEEANKNTFIQSTLKNKISLSDMSKVELHFGTLQCSGKNIENKTFFIDDGNTLYQKMNEENNSNDTININDVSDLDNLELKDKQYSTAEMLASSENTTEGSSPSSTEDNKTSSETASTTSSKTEGSVPPYRHPYAGQSYNPVFHQNNYKNYNRRNNYRENNGHFREGSNSFNNNNNNRNMGYYHKSNKYNNDFNYDNKNHHHGHSYSNNKYGYRNNYNNKYYYSNNKNNHVSYLTPYKFYNPIMAGKPIGAPAAISASPILISNAADMGGIAAYHVSSSVMNLYNNQNTPTTAYPVNINNSKDGNFATATTIPNSSNICYSAANPPYMKVFYVASSQYANPIPFNPKYQNMKSFNPNKHYYQKNKFNNNHYNSTNNSDTSENNNNNNNNSISDINNDNNNTVNNVDTGNTTASITTTTTTTITTNSGDSNDINDTQQSSSYKNYSSDETVTNDVPTASSNLDGSSSYNSENK